MTETSPSPATATKPESAIQKRSLSAWIVSAVVLLLIVSQLPLFVRMPLVTDVAYYDMQAEHVMQGGTLYADCFEPNLPGVVWAHIAIRSLLGTSWEAIRIVDFLILSSIAALGVVWCRRTGVSPLTAALWTLCCIGFYFSISEWNHCQRDTWILFPALAGLLMRIKQLQRIEANDRPAKQFGWAILEGIVWACGFWVKPFIAFPAMALWLMGTMTIRNRNSWLLDLPGILLGGACIGGMGIAWLVSTGAWPYFLETASNWNPDYFACRKNSWSVLRALQITYRLAPWSLLHLVAIPIASVLTIRGVRDSFRSETTQTVRLQQYQPLLAVMYLAWMFQAVYLQHPFDYVHVPGILLAVLLLATFSLRTTAATGWKALAAVYLTVAMLFSPLLDQQRLQNWPECVKLERATPTLYERLSLFDQVEWENLQRVADYLKANDVHDGEITIYNSTVVYLYPQLGVMPATRYVYLDAVAACCTDHHVAVREELANSPQRFIVIDLVESHLMNHYPPEESRTDEALATAKRPPVPDILRGFYNWPESYVFRSGRYVVHRVTMPK